MSNTTKQKVVNNFVEFWNDTRYVRGNPAYGKNEFHDNGDGTVSITFTGTPGAQYLLQTAPDLAPPIWTTISTNVPDTTGVATFTDSSATAASRFYRAAKP